MAILTLLDPERMEIKDPQSIKKFMNDRGIIFEQWEASVPLKDSDGQETILKAYEHELGPYMKKHGYLSADVINVNKDTPNIETIRAKFLSEHTHAEDEVRFFVDGEGMFFFHLSDRMEVFKLLCQKGDFISVPKGVTHWFDLAPKYHVKAIRVFQTPEGWVANYTHTGKEQKYHVAKLYLFDIEGTTTDINFVHKVLFPYSEKHMKEFVLHHQQDPVIATAIEDVRNTVLKEENRKLTLDEVSDTLCKWIKEDRKHPALKEIQGHIWDIGYSKNDFKGHVYPDVKPFFMKILDKGAHIGIYSSGSEHAQKLIFGYSTDGDLTPMITHYFDTKIGGKREETSYHNIATAVHLKPSEIHFFSDVPEELKAAEAAGMKVTHVLREGTRPSQFEGIVDFSGMKKQL